MKNVLFIFIAVAFIGCEPGYRVYIHNNTSMTLYIKTHPSIESIYPKPNQYYDSIIINKVSQEGEYSLYGIKPLSVFRVWDNIGSKPTSDELPFDYIELISGSDTTVLNSKEKIIEQLKQVGKNKNRNYYIEITK